MSISCNNVLLCTEPPSYLTEKPKNDPKPRQTIKDIYNYCNSYLSQISDPDFIKELYNNYLETQPKIDLDATMYLQNIGHLVEVPIKENSVLLFLIIHINIDFLKTTAGATTENGGNNIN